VTPEELERFEQSIEHLRMEALFESGDGFAPDAEQYFLLALAALDSAQRFATLATYAQRRETRS